MNNLVIIGGGLAGLSLAYFAKEAEIDFHLYEGKNSVGGNCRTLRSGEFRFDTGAHRFHDKDPEMTNIIQTILKNRIKNIYKPSYIYYDGKLIHFPITPSGLLKNLPVKVLGRSVFSFLFKNLNDKKDDNFESYAYKKYGKNIADLFLTNYSEKLWGEKCHNLSLDVAGSRLKNLNLKSIMNDIFFPNTKSKHLEGNFYYPDYGFGEIAEELKFRSGTENISTGTKVTSIETQGNEIKSITLNNNNKVETPVLVSTIPVSILLNLLSNKLPDDVMEAAENLKFRHLKLVVFFLNKNSVNDAATMYFPNNSLIFTRVYEPKNRSPFMSPESQTSLVAEIPYSSGDSVSLLSEEELVNKVKNNLTSFGFFKEDEIITHLVFNIPFAYPVLTKGFEKNYNVISRYLKQYKNLYITGRNGKFAYSWTHDMMRWGSQTIKEIEQAHSKQTIMEGI